MQTKEQMCAKMGQRGRHPNCKISIATGNKQRREDRSLQNHHLLLEFDWENVEGADFEKGADMSRRLREINYKPSDLNMPSTLTRGLSSHSMSPSALCEKQRAKKRTAQSIRGDRRKEILAFEKLQRV